MALGLDAAGFVPGEGVGAAVGQTVLGVASFLNGVFHVDPTGMIGGAAGEGIGLTYAATQLTGLGKAWAKAIPVVGYGVNTIASLHDLASAYSHGSSTYSACMSNP